MSWRDGVRDIRPSTAWVRTMGVERREDALLAGGLGVAGLVEVVLGAVPEHELVASLSVLVMAASLTVRRTRPRTALTVVLAALVAQSLLGVPTNGQVMTIPLVIVAAYSVGAHLDHRDSIVGAVIGIALTSVAIAAAGSGGSDYGFGLMLVVAPWIGGVMVRVRHAAESEAVAGAELRARQAVEEERQRIARELHDIVSHGLSAMVVQAAAAAELVDGSPQAARQAMHEIQTVGADAMTEMRHMLGLMRGADLTDRRPQPGLEDVCDLVAAEQAAGRATILTVAGTPRELPRGLTLSVYRIVQESLTNVRKHARGSHCEVTIAYTPVSLEVAVVDDGRQGHERPREPGFGIMGMRERARLYGGTLDAAPEPRGGWAVRARFPLDHDVVAS